MKNDTELDIATIFGHALGMTNKNSLRMTSDRTAPSLTKREGNKKLKELINLSTYPLIYFNKIYPRPLRERARERGESKEILRFAQNDKNKNRKELINLSTYPLINFNKIFPRPLRERARERGKKNHFLTSLPTNLLTFKAAFTLAEVLITLGIIGVVAAMTIPGLLNNYKAHRLRSQFLKSYSTAQQAFKMMEQDDVSLDPADYNQDTSKKFYNTYMNYFQGVTNCGGRAAGIKRVLPCYDVDKTSIGYYTLDGERKVLLNYFDDGQFALQDGTLFLIENAAGNSYLWISVDLNGFNNPPNRWGYDLFTFQFMDGELRTMGDKKTQYSDMNLYCNPKVSNQLNGIACAQKAKTNSDYFKELIKEFK